LLSDLTTCFQELLDAGNSYPDNLVINESLIPHITLDVS